MSEHAQHDVPGNDPDETSGVDEAPSSSDTTQEYAERTAQSIIEYERERAAAVREAHRARTGAGVRRARDNRNR